MGLPRYHRRGLKNNGASLSFQASPRSLDLESLGPMPSRHWRLWALVECVVPDVRLD